MYRRTLALLTLTALSIGGWPVLSQDNNQAAQLAERREAEERQKRMQAALDDLRDAFEAQQKRLSALADELRKLQQEQIQLRADRARELDGLATREDLRKLAEKIQEIDHKREEDKKLILREFESLSKVIGSAPAERPKPVQIPDPPVDNGNFYSYEVKEGDTLIAILNAYNAAFKKEGKPAITLDQIKKANPNLNPNSLRVGKKVLIPMPAEK